MVYITTIAFGLWADRATLSYVPVNSKLADGRRFGAFGVSAGLGGETRRPYKIEEKSGTTYVMYDDDTDGPVPIYKTVEA